MLTLFAVAMLKLSAMTAVAGLIGWFIGKVLDAHRLEREILAELEAKEARV